MLILTIQRLCTTNVVVAAILPAHTLKRLIILQKIQQRLSFYQYHFHKKDCLRHIKESVGRRDAQKGIQDPEC
jgi:hypothetical protein